MGEPAAQPRKPPPTRWSLVRSAGKKPTRESRAALGELCSLYWYPLYAFARKKGRSAEDGHDSTQAFLTRLIEKNDLATADPARGRFRSWLLKSFENFLCNERAFAHAQKRDQALVVSLDAEDADGRYRLEASHDVTPEKLFERRSTMAMQARALGALKEEYTRNGSAAVFEALKGGLIWDALPSQAALGEALGMNANAVKQAAWRLRKRHGELFYAEVADTVERPEEVEAEVRRLLSEL